MSQAGGTVGEVCGGWNPWRELRAREDVGLVLGDLPDGCRGALAMDPRGPVIVLDASLDQRERNHVLTHELVHLERGGGCPAEGMPAGWRDVVRREERRVEDEAVRRLIPPRELIDYALRRGELGETLEAWDVAEEWWVPVVVARRALELLGDADRTNGQSDVA